MSIYEYQTFHGQKWLKIFKHDIRKGKQFSTPEEALYFVTDDPDRFSILTEVTNRDKFGNSFYFMFKFNEDADESISIIGKIHRY